MGMAVVTLKKGEGRLLKSAIAFLIPPAVLYDPCPIRSYIGRFQKVFTGIIIVPSYNRHNMIDQL